MAPLLTVGKNMFLVPALNRLLWFDLFIYVCVPETVAKNE